jgi:2,4-dienoyl-CoA reductase-like NADH-dependent reductase (Old Yellow Enzyme family)
MSTRYPHVFSPIEIGPVSIRNRFYFAPHGTPLTADYSPSDDAVYYFGERAEGGVGLIIHSLSVGVRQLGRISPQDPARVESFAVLADHVHERGSKIFGQLHHSWPVRLYQWEPLGPAAPSISASVNPRFEHYSSSLEMSERDIAAWLEAMRQCVRNLRAAGYDGIEVHCTHGLLLEHFMSPYFNQRTDRYGGNLENRMRIVVEALEIARAESSEEMAVGVRFMCDELLPAGITQEIASEALALLVDRGLLDFADLDIAVEPNQFEIGMPTFFSPKLTYESFVKGVRAAAGDIPVLSALGRVTKIADAERVIAEGTADMVGAARGLIAEPELVKHAAEGNEDQSRTCIACNWCLGGDPYSCAINPSTGKERRVGPPAFPDAPTPGRVVVVGGGPGGLEAARTAARRGHDVILFERGERLGGHVNLWAMLPGRESVATSPPWYARELRRLDVDVRLGIEASADAVLRERPDGVIVATGSAYDRTGRTGLVALPIPGWDHDFVLTPEDILAAGKRPSGRVVIFDDESMHTAPGIAELLVQETGADVEVISRWSHLAHHLDASFQSSFVNARLKRLGVTISAQEHLREIGDHRVMVFDVHTEDERTLEDVDAVVICAMRNPVNALVAQLDGSVDQLFAIGDALAPRALASATHEAHRFARMLGEPGAPRNFTEAWYEPVPPEAFGRPAKVLRSSAVSL